MSSIGSAMAYRSKMETSRWRARPSWTTLTSKVVPPMSTAITSSRPAAAAIDWVAMVPATGPDCTVRIGACRASSLVIAPPAHCANCTVPTKPAPRHRPGCDRRTPPSAGRCTSSSTAVIVRSYSPAIDERSELQDTKSSGATSRTISRARCSCAGLTVDHRNEIVTASIPAAMSSCTAWRTPASSSGTMMSPSTSMRSVTGRINSCGISGSGL